MTRFLGVKRTATVGGQGTGMGSNRLRRFANSRNCLHFAFIVIFWTVPTGTARAKEPLGSSTREIWMALVRLERQGDSALMAASLRQLLDEHAGDTRIETLVRNFIESARARNPGLVPRRLDGVTIALPRRSERQTDGLYFSPAEIAALRGDLNDLSEATQRKLVLLAQEGPRRMPPGKEPPVRIVLDAGAALLKQVHYDLHGGRAVSEGYALSPAMADLLQSFATEIGQRKILFVLKERTAGSDASNAFSALRFRDKPLGEWGVSLLTFGAHDLPAFDVVPDVESVSALLASNHEALAKEADTVFRYRDEVIRAAQRWVEGKPSPVDEKERAALLDESARLLSPARVELQHLGLKPVASTSNALARLKKRMIETHPQWAHALENPGEAVERMLAAGDVETLERIVDVYRHPEFLSALTRALGARVTPKSEGLVRALAAHPDPDVVGFLIVNTFGGREGSKYADAASPLLEREGPAMASLLARWFSDGSRGEVPPVLRERLRELYRSETTPEGRLDLVLARFRAERDSRSMLRAIAIVEWAAGIGKISAAVEAVHALLEQLRRTPVPGSTEAVAALLARTELSEALGPISKFLNERAESTNPLIRYAESRLKNLALLGATAERLGPDGAREFFALLRDRGLRSPTISRYLEELPHWRRSDREAYTEALATLRAFNPDRAHAVGKELRALAGIGTRVGPPGSCAERMGALDNAHVPYVVAAGGVMGVAGEAATGFEHVRALYDLVGRDEP